MRCSVFMIKVSAGAFRKRAQRFIAPLASMTLFTSIWASPPETFHAALIRPLTAKRMTKVDKRFCLAIFSAFHIYFSNIPAIFCHRHPEKFAFYEPKKLYERIFFRPLNPQKLIFILKWIMLMVSSQRKYLLRLSDRLQRQSVNAWRFFSVPLAVHKKTVEVGKKTTRCCFY